MRNTRARIATANELLGGRALFHSCTVISLVYAKFVCVRVVRIDGGEKINLIKVFMVYLGRPLAQFYLLQDVNLVFCKGFF